MSREMYLCDCYQKEFDAKVLEINDGKEPSSKFVVLNQSCFYPNGGGQPTDEGYFLKERVKIPVLYVGKFDGKVSHQVELPEGVTLEVGDEISGVIDWDRRYKLMRYHTASHIISGVINEKTGALITGNQISLEKGRIDYNLENYDRDVLMGYFDDINAKISENLEVNSVFLDIEEAKKEESLFKLANAMPPEIKELRVVDVGGFDRQACGGTHVKNTSEIGRVEFMKADNRGKNNRRVYFRLVD